jgi:signal transduction histidine kinase/CheY-like chemotaxis protein
MWQMVRKREAVSVLFDDPDFSQLVTEADVDGGALSLFALGDLGLLKLYARSATSAMDDVELSQLVTITRKLTTSLQGCLAHAGIVYEIAERERAEEERQAVQQQLQQAQKMEAVGRLAGGIAHDFNNLLVAVLGHAELLASDAREQPRLQDGLEAIATAARRAADLTGQLLAFSRKGQVQSTSVHVDDLVLEVVGLLSRTIDPKIRVETDLRSSGACVVGEPAQLHTVLLNLALNARDAMPGGGVIRIETGLALPPRRHSEAANASAEWVELVVADTGGGMDSATADRVFEPFFTTKELGQGTGLGLAAAYGIVQSHGGEITVESSPGKGSTFRVRLPRGDIEHVARAKEDCQPPFLGQGVALLVDDDASVRGTIARMLQRLGFDVVEACNGQEALAILDESAEFSLMVLDLKMPVMDGVSTLRELPPAARRIPVIVISGFAERADQDALPELGVRHVLRKPFSLKQVSAALSDCLGSQVTR